MKRGLLISFLLLFCAIASGQELPKFTFGAEWSYSAAFFSSHRFYYIATEGHRIDDRGASTGYYSDGEVYLHGGINLNPKWNLSLFAGFAGLADYHGAIPVSLRATRYFGDNHLSDRWFSYMDLGSGFSLTNRPRELFTAKVGGGYRISLSRLTKLDFIASLHYIHTHPNINYHGTIIPDESVGRNNANIISASFGLGITF